MRNPDNGKCSMTTWTTWCFKVMFEIPWTVRVTDENVLDEIKEKRLLCKSIQSRRDKMTGHILRHEDLLKKIIEGDAEG